MPDVDHYLFGDAVLHHRLSITAGILGELVMRAPRSVSIAGLEEAIGHPARELEKVCQHMWRDGLLHPDPEIAGNWMLAGSPSDITLEHVFRSALSAALPQRKLSMPTQLAPDLDLLLMQATLGVNQNVFSHLRQFPLDRLKIRSVSFPPSRHGRHASQFEDLPAASLPN